MGCNLLMVHLLIFGALMHTTPAIPAKTLGVVIGSKPIQSLIQAPLKRCNLALFDVMNQP